MREYECSTAVNRTCLKKGCNTYINGRFHFFYSIDVFIVMNIHKFNFKCFNFEFSAFQSHLKWGKRRAKKLTVITGKRRQYCTENFFLIKMNPFLFKKLTY